MAFTFLLFVVLGLKDAKQVNQLPLSYTLSLILHFKHWKELHKMMFYDTKDRITVNSLIGAQLCSLLHCPQLPVCYRSRTGWMLRGPMPPNVYKVVSSLLERRVKTSNERRVNFSVLNNSFYLYLFPEENLITKLQIKLKIECQKL